MDSAESMMEDANLERRIRLASILVILGLTIQLLTLFWNHPLAFLAFILVGSPVVLAGVALYLYAIVHR